MKKCATVHWGALSSGANIYDRVCPKPRKITHGSTSYMEWRMAWLLVAIINRNELAQKRAMAYTSYFSPPGDIFTLDFGYFTWRIDTTALTVGVKPRPQW